MDSAFFGRIVPDTNNPHNWTRLYDEMYHAAYDTTTMMPIDDVLQQQGIKISNDSIHVALMDFRYNLLKPDALTTANYFNFDTANSAITYNANGLNAYRQMEMFAGSTLELESHVSNPMFKIDPALLFRDPGMSYDYNSEWGLQINFDDNTGWHAFTSYGTQYYQALYKTSGNKAIQYRLVYNGVGVLAYTIDALG